MRRLKDEIAKIIPMVDKVCYGELADDVKNMLSDIVSHIDFYAVLEEENHRKYLRELPEQWRMEEQK